MDTTRQQLDALRFRALAATLNGKSPLKYPGGKSCGVDDLLSLRPLGATHYFEPFVGGASVALRFGRLAPPTTSKLINDLDPTIYWFWNVLRDLPESLIGKVEEWRRSITDSRKLLRHAIEGRDHSACPVEVAAGVFIVSRLGRDGRQQSPSLSSSIGERGRGLTINSLNALAAYAYRIQNFEITNLDWPEVIDLVPAENSFVFLDPPYAGKGEQLYRKGRIDIDRLLDRLDEASFPWLLTIQEDAKSLGFARRWGWVRRRYSSGCGRPAPAVELVISNYTEPARAFFDHRREAA